MSTMTPDPHPAPLGADPTESTSVTDWFEVGGLDGLAGFDGGVWGDLDRLSRAVRVPEASLQDTLVAILRGAVNLLDNTHGAGINLLISDGFTPQAVLGQAPPVLDEWQRDTGTGPCIEASREQTTIAIADTGTGPRWSPFGARAAALGVGSMLCVPLWVDERRLGSLSLYGVVPGAFGQTATRVAGLFATHAALALGDAHRTESLRRALATRDVIGQAKGILMATRGLTAPGAFTLLVNTSQRLNRKLVDIAQELADTGALPT